MIKRISHAILIVGMLLAIGTVAYNGIEGWSYFDSLYFSTITLTTIGYGDMYPITVPGKVFTMFYAVIGISMMLYLMTYVISGFLIKQEEKLVGIFPKFKAAKSGKKR